MRSMKTRDEGVPRNAYRFMGGMEVGGRNERNSGTIEGATGEINANNREGVCARKFAFAQTLACIIHDGSLRNCTIACARRALGVARTRGVLEQYVEGLSREAARLAAGEVRPGLSQQRGCDCSRSDHE